VFEVLKVHRTKEEMMMTTPTTTPTTMPPTRWRQ